MGQIDLLHKLARARVCSWALEMNDNRIGYETPRQQLEDIRERCGVAAIDDALLAEVDATGELVSLTVYPNTPVGHVTWYAGSLDKLLERLEMCPGFLSLLEGEHYVPPEPRPPPRVYGEFAVHQVSVDGPQVKPEHRDRLVGMMSDAIKATLDRATNEGLVERLDLPPALPLSVTVVDGESEDA